MSASSGVRVELSGGPLDGDRHDYSALAGGDAAVDPRRVTRCDVDLHLQERNDPRPGGGRTTEHRIRCRASGGKTVKPSEMSTRGQFSWLGRFSPS
jgi:hypothetical protein